MLRAFWMAPSMANLFLAGDQFANTLLTPKQRALEQGTADPPAVEAPRLIRYPVPEFEAMKAVMAKGVVAPRSDAPWSRPCADIAPGDDKEWHWGAATCRLPGLTLRLPAVKPSLFKRSDRLLPTTTDIENISAEFGIVERGKTVGAPQWESARNENSRYTGSWDIGEYELLLDKPVVEHVIGRTGLVGAYAWTPQQRITPNGIVEDCASNLSEERRGKELLPGYPSIKDGLLWFHSPQALPYKTATIRARVERGAKAAVDDSPRIRRVVVYDIDLNHDGIPDFEEWEIWGTSGLSASDSVVVRWEQYVNVEGRWYPFAYNYYVECS